MVGRCAADTTVLTWVLVGQETPSAQEADPHSTHLPALSHTLIRARALSLSLSLSLSPRYAGVFACACACACVCVCVWTGRPLKGKRLRDALATGLVDGEELAAYIKKGGDQRALVRTAYCLAAALHVLVRGTQCI